MSKVKILNVRVSGRGNMCEKYKGLIMSYDEIDLFRYHIAQNYGVEMSQVNVTYTEDIAGESDYY